MVHLLEKEFVGIGEVKGFKFKQIDSTPLGYIYLVDTGNSIHYEVFKRVNSPVCIDFKKRLYSENDYKETYPKSNSFGITAWSCNKLLKAANRLESFKEKEVKRGI